MILWYSLQAIKHEIRGIDIAISLHHLQTVIIISRKQADKKRFKYYPHNANGGEQEKVELSQQTVVLVSKILLTADKVKAIFTLFFKDPWKSECSLSHRAPEPESKRITWELEWIRPCKYASTQTGCIISSHPAAFSIALAVIWESLTERGWEGRKAGWRTRTAERPWYKVISTNEPV